MSHNECYFRACKIVDGWFRQVERLVRAQPCCMRVGIDSFSLEYLKAYVGHNPMLSLYKTESVSFTLLEQARTEYRNYCLEYLLRNDSRREFQDIPLP
jgi:hypothetical protein